MQSKYIYPKLSFRSAAVSREESAVLPTEADSSPIELARNMSPMRTSRAALAARSIDSCRVRKRVRLRLVS